MKKLLLLSIALCSIFNAFATNKYVSPSGNNSFPGTELKPWRTFQNAANKVHAGDTVFFRGGVYNEKVSINVTGTANGGYITFINYPNETPIIDGTGKNAKNIIEVYGPDYLRFIGFEIRNSIGNDRSGIVIEYGAHHIEILKNNIHDIHFDANPNATVGYAKNAHPIIIYGDHPGIACSSILIDSNEIHDCRTGFSEGISLDGNVSNFVVSNNHIYDITNIGIVMAGHYKASPNAATDQARSGVCRNNVVYDCGSAYAEAAGIYVDGGKDIIIEKNEIFNCQYGIEVGCEEGKNANGKNVYTASNVEVRNNWLHHNSSGGIAFGGYNYPASAGRVVDCSFHNNTLIANDTDTLDDLHGEIILTASKNCEVKNNIISAGGNYLIERGNKYAPGLLFDYNLWFTAGGAANAIVVWTVGNNVFQYNSFQQYKNATGQDDSSLFADPQFQSGANNVHLLQTSPAVNAGDPSFIAGAGETDFDGDARIFAGRVDMGADESFAGSNRVSAVANALNVVPELRAYPNPATDFIHIVSSREDAGRAVSFSIISLNGKEMFRGKMPCVVDVRQWEQGLYVVRSEDGGLVKIWVE